MPPTRKVEEWTELWNGWNANERWFIGRRGGDQKRRTLHNSCKACKTISYHTDIRIDQTGETQRPQKDRERAASITLCACKHNFCSMNWNNKRNLCLSTAEQFHVDWCTFRFSSRHKRGEGGGVGKAWRTISSNTSYAGQPSQARFVYSPTTIKINKPRLDARRLAACDEWWQSMPQAGDWFDATFRRLISSGRTR